MPERRWEDPARRPEYRSEEALDRRFRRHSRDECHIFPSRNEDLASTHDMVRADNESSNSGTARFQKRKSHTITPHRPTLNPHQKKMIQKN